MENISKAVIKAGGVLIAVGVISLALYVYNNLRDYAASSSESLTISQIQSFNNFYESYPGEITGADYQNIYNKAVEDEVMINGSFVPTRIALDPSQYLTSYNYRPEYDFQGKVFNVVFY